MSSDIEERVRECVGGLYEGGDSVEDAGGEGGCIRELGTIEDKDLVRGKVHSASSTI